MCSHLLSAVVSFSALCSREFILKNFVSTPMSIEFNEGRGVQCAMFNWNNRLSYIYGDSNPPYCTTSGSRIKKVDHRAHLESVLSGRCSKKPEGQENLGQWENVEITNV